jgi:DNA-binding NarL/FixJ family response regulator
VKSTFNEPVVIALAYEKGASGFVTHSATPEYLVTVIKTVASGSIFFPDLSEKNRSVQPEVLLGYTHKVSQLSSRQLDILVRVAEGKLNKEISNEVNLSLFTVKAHMKTILRVLGVVSRTEAAIIARQVGLNEHTLPDFVGEHQGTSSFRFRHKVNRLVY